MKRLSLIVAVSAALCSCSMRTDAEFFGSNSSYYDKSSPGETYLITLADNLIVDNLRQLEKALIYNDYFEYESKQFETGGKSIETVGAEWTCRDISSIKGVKISCTAAGTWTLTRSDKYLLDGGDSFPTTYSIEAIRGAGSSTHYDWTVTVTGNRIEEKGYACRFWTETGESLVFTRGESPVWENCNGKILMEVTRNGEKIDKALLDFKGGKENYVYLSGLK